MEIYDRCLNLCLSGVLLTVLTGGLSAEESSNPSLSTLYEGVVAVDLDQGTDSPLLLTNPQAMAHAPLKDVLARVEELTQMQVHVNWQSLTGTGLDIDLDKTMLEWPAGESIRQLLERIHGHEKNKLTWVVGDNLISLMSAEQAKEKYTTQRYYIGDLLSADLSAEHVSNSIEEHTSGPWDVDEPGTGTATPFGNHLFIRQTFRVQREVNCVLAALRSQAPIVLIYQSEEDLRLRRMWDEKIVSFDWPQITLAEFSRRLAELTGARFQWDEQALADSGLVQDTLIDAKSRNLPLRKAVELNLSHFDGSYLMILIDDGVFKIIDGGKNCGRFETVLYNVSSLGITGERLEQFVNLLETETSGPWDAEEPGTGSISVFPHRSSLLIRQTPKVHREILELLRDLRNLPKSEPLFGAPKGGDKHVQTKYYNMAPETAFALAKVIPESIAMGTWEPEDSKSASVPQANPNGKIQVVSKTNLRHGRITVVKLPERMLQPFVVDPSSVKVPFAFQFLGAADVERQAFGGTGPAPTLSATSY